MLPRNEVCDDWLGVATLENQVVLQRPEWLANCLCWIGHVERTNDRDYEIEERYVIFVDSLLDLFDEYGS